MADEQNITARSILARVFLFVKRLFIAVGVLTTAIIILFSVALGDLVTEDEPRSLPDNIILTYSFKSGLVEKVTKPSFAQPLLRPATTFHDVVDALNRAAKDSRVKGFTAKIQDIDVTPAQFQELRDTVATFRKAGKFASVFAEDFGGFRSGMGDYYLASSFDQIWLQPVGGVSITGISAEVPFFRGMLDKIGVEPEFSHKGIYKSAPESLTETGMSGPHRDMMKSLIGDLSDQIVTGIAADRKILPGLLLQIINDAPYNDAEALRLQLVDHLGYYDEMIADAKSHAKDAETVELKDYAALTDPSDEKSELKGKVAAMVQKAKGEKAPAKTSKIALIIGTGNIVSYKNGRTSSGMTAEKIVSAFEDAEKDADVRAIVFRIDSPGGSPAAAESIRRAVLTAQQAGKPVVVSMGGYAASGGYWIAAPADKIVAEPATITGSIGVFGGKFVLSALFEKMGMNWEAIAAGDNARMWSFNKEFSSREKSRFEAMLGNIYESFITRVMQGRKMTREQVVAVAEGRVWTGRQAKEKGLVDELGGQDKAVELAKAAAKLPADAEVVQFPPHKSALEMFIELATEGVSVAPDININVGDVLKQLSAAADPQAEILKAGDIQLH